MAATVFACGPSAMSFLVSESTDCKSVSSRSSNLTRSGYRVLNFAGEVGLSQHTLAFRTPRSPQLHKTQVLSRRHSTPYVISINNISRPLGLLNSLFVFCDRAPCRWPRSSSRRHRSRLERRRRCFESVSTTQRSQFVRTNRDGVFGRSSHCQGEPALLGKC